MQLIVEEFISEPEPLNSSFYIHRPVIEEKVYKQITKPGSFTRIQAPRQMGKTSLVLRLINHAKNLGYQTVYLDFLQVENAVCASLDIFLRWFCANVSYHLNLPLMLDKCWDEEIGSKVNSTVYFQNYLLENLNSPLVLVLNGLDILFEYSEIAPNFLSMLRAWYEEARKNEVFQKLRLVTVLSTEVYINLNINQSPLNVGLAIKLPEFSLEEIQELAQRHGLNWKNKEGRQKALSLQAMAGGHPYLVRLALHHLVNSPHISLEQLLQEAATISGIYSHHLRRMLATLQYYPELGTAFKQVIAAGSLSLNHILAYKLEGLGLVKINGNQCQVFCELYRLYFTSQNIQEQNWQEKFQKLQIQNQELQRLVNTDSLTQLPNKHFFDIYLEQQWQSLQIEKYPLSLIVCEVDYFQMYNKTRGQVAGDNCLRLVAKTVCDCTKNLPGLQQEIIARYSATQFAIILPKTNANIAFRLAEIIREKVIKLAIPHDDKIGGLPAPFVTVTLGVACTIPNIDDSPRKLVDAVEEILSFARRHNRNCTYVSTDLNYGF